mmetsp:Transcript_10511/g.23775  ORF Transcript_10511/g.23775 Transcript_10511/m.23775 type:complete len:359 (+) Transcript_10511:686-1762(+)
MEKQRLEGLQSATLKHNLRLLIVTRDDVAHRPQRGCLHQGRGVPKELDEPLADAGLNDGIDPLIRAVRQVRECPARVRQDLHVIGVDQVRERRQGRGDPLEGRRRLAAAEIGERPAGVARHGDLLRGHQDMHHGVKAAALQHEVAEVRRVSRDVAQCPDSLLPHVVAGRRQQLHKDRQGTLFHDHAGLVGIARSNVGEHPGGLELEIRSGNLLQELHESRHDAGIDDLLDGRVLLHAQEFPEGLRGGELSRRVLGGQLLAEALQLFQSAARHAPHLLHGVAVQGDPGLRCNLLFGHALLLQGFLAVLLPELHRGILALAPGLVRVDALLEVLLPVGKAVTKARHCCGRARHNGRMIGT